MAQKIEPGFSLEDDDARRLKNTWQNPILLRKDGYVPTGRIHTLKYPRTKEVPGEFNGKKSPAEILR